MVETYTVEYDRENRPVLGHVVGRLRGSGKRFVANHGDGRTLEIMGMGHEEVIGMVGIVREDAEMEGRNLFCLSEEGERKARL